MASKDFQAGKNKLTTTLQRDTTRTTVRLIVQIALVETAERVVPQHL